MDRWHLPSIEAIGKREPRVLFSTPACRAVIIDLQAGESMGDHQVHEQAVVQIVSGKVRLGPLGAEAECGAGVLATFAPGERHTLSAVEVSRILLLLAPWPGKGHYQEGQTPDPERMPSHPAARPIQS